MGLALTGCKGEGDAPSGGVSTTRDATVGARYGSAGPRICGDRKAPASAAISVAQATAYVICGEEQELVDNLFLVADIAISDVSPAWKFEGIPGESTPDLDVTKPIHSIRGKMVIYECNRLGVNAQHGPNHQRGTNCQMLDHPNAEGLCYRQMTGDWACTFEDNDYKLGRQGLPPPA